MHSVLVILLGIMALFTLPCVYMAFTILFYFKKPKPHPEAEEKLRFAVIIPARNEETVIGTLINALHAQNYPSDKFDIIVAVNHCTDNTAEVARQNGARIFQCSDNVRRKGDVLHEAIAALKDEQYEAFAIFDADNIPHPDFLRAMNNAMAAGERICKGRLKAGNPSESWVSGSYGLYHVGCEQFFGRPHTTMGLSSNLVGTGFAFHRDLMDALGGWNTVTLCEDTEILAQATSIGYRVAFVYDALSYDEQVAQFLPSLTQRMRWSRGMAQVAVRYIPKLFFGKCPKRGMAFDLGTLFFLCITAPLNLPLGIITFFMQPPKIQLLILCSLPLYYLCIALVAILLLKLGGYDLKKTRSTIFMFPFFLLSWMPLQLLALFVPIKTWKPVIHRGQSEIS